MLFAGSDVPCPMSYRNDVDALQMQLNQVEDQLAGIRGERSRLEVVKRDEPRLVGELDRLRREIHARAPRKLPVLDRIQVASPCNESWDTMTGNDQARFCGRCEKNVYNLSAMTREAAEALLVAKEGKACVRYFQRPDGTVLTADCPVGVRRKRVRMVAAVTAVTALAAGAMSAVAFAQMGAPAPMGAPAQRTAMQGDVSPPVVQVTPSVGPVPVPPPVLEHMGVAAPTMGEPVFQGQVVSETPRPTVRNNTPRMGRPMIHHER